MCGGLVCVMPVCHPQDRKKARSVHTDLPAPAPLVCLFYITAVFCTWAGFSPPLFFPLSLFYSFSLCCCIYLSLRAWQGAITLSSRSCAVLCFSLRLFLLLAVVLVPLPRPPAPSIPLCSLCARSVSRALTSRCDPTEPRWLWYTVQSSW